MIFVKKSLFAFCSFFVTLIGILFAIPLSTSNFVNSEESNAVVSADSCVVGDFKSAYFDTFQSSSSTSYSDSNKNFLFSETSLDALPIVAPVLIDSFSCFFDNSNACAYLPYSIYSSSSPVYKFISYSLRNESVSGFGFTISSNFNALDYSRAGFSSLSSFLLCLKSYYNSLSNVELFFLPVSDCSLFNFNPSTNEHSFSFKYGSISLSAVYSGNSFFNNYFCLNRGYTGDISMHNNCLVSFSISRFCSDYNLSLYDVLSNFSISFNAWGNTLPSLSSSYHDCYIYPCLISRVNDVSATSSTSSFKNFNNCYIFDEKLGFLKSFNSYLENWLNLTNSTSYDSAYNTGYNLGYNSGYSVGYNKGADNASSYTFLALIGAVIDAPVSAFSNLFNFSLLGINLKDFILGLFTLCVIVTVVRLVLGR